jgi:23S rRNA (adenine2503-C2)-methyltransferase
MDNTTPTSPSTPQPSSADRPHLRGMDLAALTDFLQRTGQPGYRAKQIFQWVYEKGAQSYDAMTNLPKDLRAWLQENTVLGGLTLQDMAGAPDETQKLVFRTDDGEFIESVLMRGEEEEESEDFADAPKGSTAPQRKVSLCVSSQVGCALACQFCMTGFGGFRRNLRVDEILDQVIAARQLIAADERIANIVFMGMGEPMLNLPAVLPAIRLLITPEAFGIATRRITVSTAGILPGIEQFGQAATDVNLAVSLNATTQEVRDRLMPAVRKYPLDALLEACRNFPLTKRRRITFEYILLKGLNDTPDDVRRLTKLLRGIPCKINLILYNPSAEIQGLEPTDEETASRFRAALAEANYTASLRHSKGARYEAACGQLAGHFKRREQGE